MKKHRYSTVIIISIAIAGLFILPSCKSGTKEADWKKIELGSMGLSIDAPFTFKEKDISNQLTPSVKKMIQKMEMYINEDKKEYYAVSTVEYTPEVNFSMDGAVNGAISEMRMKSGGKTSNRKDDKIKVDGNDATRTTVTISNLQKEEMELQMVIINKEKKMYQIMGLYESGNATAAKNTSRMLESIKIK